MVVFDLMLQQIFGATNAEVTFADGSSFTYDFPELIGLTLALMPDSSVRLSWNSRLGSTYQVESLDTLDNNDLGSNGWLSVGEPVPGTGTNNCLTLPAGGAQGFYRVRTIE